MPGRFKKAPLVYVTARIRTTPLPTLAADQTAMVQQAMMKCGLLIAEKSQSQVFGVAKLIALESDQQKVNTDKLATTVERQGFFNSDRTECLIVAKDTIEWRASTYTKYDAFIKAFEKTLNALLDSVDVYGFVLTQELTLSYADVFAPKVDRRLSDYFSKSENILPLNFLNNDDDYIQQVGLVQVTRVTTPTEKISISLEQLPIIDGKIKKCLPETLREPDNNFSMPLHLQEEWSNLDGSDYGLLLTQASTLNNVILSDFDYQSTFGELHKLTRNTFRSLINRTICNVDWEYERAEGVSTNASELH